MKIYDITKFDKHNDETISKPIEIILVMLLFGSVGAIAWAIRGTAGWGGVDGTIIPGLMWGVLWYYLAFRKGIDARGIILWLGLGLALGGELGYGQYTSWIRGMFYVGDEIIYIEPWLGYFWFAMCGIGWAAPGGIILGWALGKRVSASRWILRSLLLFVLLVFLFAWPFVDWLSLILVKSNSGILFPNAELGIYAGELGKHLSRTIYTNTQNFAVVIWWIVALVEALINRDKTTLVVGLILGAGFGFGFMQSAAWALGYGVDPKYIDWWKIWELNSGFNLGILYAVTFYWAVKHSTQNMNSDKIVKDSLENGNQFSKWKDTLFLAFAGSILLFFVGFEYFFWTGLGLTLFYFVSILLTSNKPINNSEISERRKNVFLIYSIFYLIFLMFHGGSETLGIVLELYEEDAVSQYSWPLERILLFAPVALFLISVAIIKIKNALSGKTLRNDSTKVPSNLSVWILDLIMILGFIGALSIWPAKIGIIYALFIFLSVFAFNRLEQRFNVIDEIKTNYE